MSHLIRLNKRIIDLDYLISVEQEIQAKHGAIKSDLESRKQFNIHYTVACEYINRSTAREQNLQVLKKTIRPIMVSLDAHYEEVVCLISMQGIDPKSVTLEDCEEGFSQDKSPEYTANRIAFEEQTRRILESRSHAKK